MIDNPITSPTFGDLVVKVADLVAKVALPIAALFIIIAGLMFVMARGNEDTLKKAKKTLLWAVLGTAIIVGARYLAEAIVELVKGL